MRSFYYGIFSVVAPRTAVRCYAVVSYLDWNRIFKILNIKWSYDKMLIYWGRGPHGKYLAIGKGIRFPVWPSHSLNKWILQYFMNSNITSPVPPKIVDAAVRKEPGSQVSCSATGTRPIYIALIRNFTVLMNKTDSARSKLYQEGNYTCVATSKYGTDVKHFVIQGGEKIRYFETNTMHTELRLAIWHIIIVSHNRDKGRDSRRADSAPTQFSWS